MMAIRFLGLVLLLAVFTQGKIAFDVAPVPAREQQFLTERFQNRIINGKDAEKGQFPYQIGMYMDLTSFCGGSIISQNWVLTAAHCVDQIKLFTVYFGALNMNLPTEPGRIVINSRTAHKHEKYDRRTVDNDVGLVKIVQGIPSNDLIKVIPLPPKKYADRDFDGQDVRVSGWGKLRDDALWISNKLQYVDLTVISNSECKKSYGNIVTDKIVCATGPDGKSTCNGDSGGPLVVVDPETNTTTHFAVVSFVSGKGCASGAPSGYDRTYKFLDWINEKTGIPIA